MIIINSKKSLFFSGIFLGAVIVYGISYLILSNSDQNKEVYSLENRVKNLEASLADKDDDLKNLRRLALRQYSQGQLPGNSVTEMCKQVNENRADKPAQYDSSASIADAPSSIQILKNLGSSLASDPRSFSEKANELLSSEPTKEKIAIVSKGIFDMAGDRESLPDYALQSMYNNQSDSDLKRVIAQVLSSRGNNSLIDSQIAEAQTHLESENPTERQHALTELAKTHSSTAANAIAPFLLDPAIDVRLDALLALRATGNQTYVSLVEKLLNDPDPAVSSLANDVANNLSNLSDSARTRVVIADIAAELPVMENP